MEFLQHYLSILGALPPDAARQLDVLGHDDGHALAVDARQVAVLKEADQVGLSGLLQSEKGFSAPSQVLLEVLCVQRKIWLAVV